MNKYDASNIACGRLKRHIAKLYFPSEALRLDPRLTIDEVVANAIVRVSRDYFNTDVPLSILLESLLYSCDTLESEYVHLRKVPPCLSEELEELFALYDRTKKHLLSEWHTYLDKRKREYRGRI